MSTIPPSSHLQSTGIGQSIKHHHEELACGIAAVSFIAFGIFLLAVKPSLLQLRGSASIAGSVTSLLFGTGFTAAAIYNLVKNTKQRTQEQYEENKNRVLESTTALEVIIAGKALQKKYPDKVNKEKTIKIECSDGTVELPFYLIKAFELSKEDYLLPFPDVNSNSLERILNFMNSNSLDSVDYQAKSLERFLQRYDTKKLEDVKKIIELYEKYVKSREVGNLLKSSFGNFLSSAFNYTKEPETLIEILQEIGMGAKEPETLNELMQKIYETQQQQYEKNKNRVLESKTARDVIIAARELQKIYPEEVRKERPLSIHCADGILELPFFFAKALELDSLTLRSMATVAGNELSLPQTNLSSFKMILKYIYGDIGLNPSTKIDTFTFLNDVNYLDIVDVETKILKPFLQQYDKEKLDDVKEIIELYKACVKSGIGNLISNPFVSFLCLALKYAKEPTTLIEVLREIAPISFSIITNKEVKLKDQLDRMAQIGSIKMFSIAENGEDVDTDENLSYINEAKIPVHTLKSTGRNLREIRRLPQTLECLMLTESNITDADLPHLPPKLKALTISSPNITIEGLSTLPKSLTKLALIGVNSSQFKDLKEIPKRPDIKLELSSY